MKNRRLLTVQGITHVMQENQITWSITKHEDGKRWNVNADKNGEPIFKTIYEEEKIIEKMKEQSSVWPSLVFQNHPKEVIKARLVRILFKELSDCRFGDKYIDSCRPYPKAETISY